MWGERGYGDGSSTYAWLSSITLLPWLPDFPPPAFHTTISSFPPPSSVSQQSTAALTPQSLISSSQMLHLPEDLHPCPGMYGCSKECLILIPLRLPQISYFTLSLKCFSSNSDNCPDVGLGPLLQFPNLQRAGAVLLMLLFFPQSLCPTEFCVSLYILFSGQVLLSALSWCSACTPVSEGVFLMYLWREMYPMSALSSAILFFSLGHFLQPYVICVFSKNMGFASLHREQTP